MFVSTFLPINLNLICNLIIPEQKPTTCQVFFKKEKASVEALSTKSTTFM